MPTLSELQASVRGFIQAKSWDTASGSDAGEFGLRAQNILLGFAASSQQKMPLINVYRALIRSLRRHIDVLVEKEIIPGPVESLELELAEWVFTHITISFHGGVDYWDYFLRIPPADTAFLISQLCREIIEHDWQIPDKPHPLSLFSWMQEQENLLSQKQQTFFRLGESLSDNMVLFSIPDTPEFCIKSDGTWCILDDATVTGMEQANETYRKTLADIENSGPTGVDYEISHAGDDVRALNNVLTAWHRNFPAHEYGAAQTELKRQEIISSHEQWLDRADTCLDLAVSESLPEEVRQIPTLLSQLLLLETRLAEAVAREQQPPIAEQELLDEEEQVDIEVRSVSDDAETVADGIEVEDVESSTDIAERITLVHAQLEYTQKVRNETDVDGLKNEAFEKAQVSIVIAKDASRILLNYNQDNAECVLTELELRTLVNQATDDFVARGYKLKEPDQPGQFRNYLDACREKQEGHANQCRANLHTADNNHVITPGRLRDPIDRRLYIDVETRTCARDFREIVIGGCILAVAADSSLVLPENIRSFVEQQDAGYAGMAKAKFGQFRANKLKLPTPKQMRVASK